MTQSHEIYYSRTLIFDIHTPIHTNLSPSTTKNYWILSITLSRPFSHTSFTLQHILFSSIYDVEMSSPCPTLFSLGIFMDGRSVVQYIFPIAYLCPRDTWICCPVRSVLFRRSLNVVTNDMSLTLTVIVFLMFGYVSAQFDFFGNMFGQQQQHQQQHRSGASQWAAHVESVACSQYLCPTTLDCVAKPMDCPCPDVQDVKCTIPDSDGDEATVVCVRGQNECADVDRLMRRRFRSK